MDEEEILEFNSLEEEARYWKETALQFRERVDELEKELEDFQENSSQLERELEKSLEHADKTNRDLQLTCSRLNNNLDLTKEKYEKLYTQTSKQLSEQQKELTDYREKEEKMLKFIRDLEQKNDDLERCQRVMVESVSDRDTKLNTAIERNALLENELDEKELLKATIQRQKDDIRDLQQELNRYIRQAMPDNDKILDVTVMDSNKLSMETQTPVATMKMSPSIGQLSQSNRLSALNLVGDLLKKVGSLESKLAASKIAKDVNESPARESYRTRNQRLNRGTASPGVQTTVRM